MNRLLVFIGVLLVVAFVVVLRTPVPGAVVAATPADPPPLVPAPIQTPRLPPALSYADMVARPLFVSGRRGAAAASPAAADAVQPSGPLVSYKLMGVSLAAAGQWALIVDTRTQKPQRLARGAVIEGWRLETIESERVVFSGGAQRSELRLQRGAAAPGAALAGARPRAGNPARTATPPAGIVGVDPRAAALRGFMQAPMPEESGPASARKPPKPAGER